MRSNGNMNEAEIVVGGGCCLAESINILCGEKNNKKPTDHCPAEMKLRMPSFKKQACK